MNRLYTLLALLALCLSASAQRFFHLASEQVSVDTVLPHFCYTIPLPDNYRDSVYTATVVYPEFIDMTPTDIANYRRLSADSLPALPEVDQQVLLDRRMPLLSMDFCPLVYRDGKYQILVSFMLRVDARAAGVSGKAKAAPRAASGTTRAADAASRYAAHSVLATGKWAKIRVPETGVYELTSAVARQAGFTDLSRVHIYGYGGNLQNEVLDGDELASLDDLKEVPTCTVNGHRLFHALGPVSWSNNTATRRTRNPYSDYGYYFLTESDAVPASVDSATFVSSFYPSADDYHSLYEVDGFSWYEGGRNLFDPEPINDNTTKRLVVTHPKAASRAHLSVNVTAGQNARVTIAVNDSVLGTVSVTVDKELEKGNERAVTYELPRLHEADTVKITPLAGGPVHLDYVSLAYDQPAPAPDLTQDFPAPTYVYNITNQDHHADPQADMVIIIPTSQVLLGQAQRLAAYHEQHDSLRINIVPADELYNEFSSGTPDANAYRRYMKMLYDRAAAAGTALPRYLLLFGDGVWDNRMRTSVCRDLNPDDYLLCYESENSFNEVYCYVDDGFFGYLDDGEGINLQSGSGNKTDMLDLAIGRFPVTTADEAKIMVDKAISYMNNEHAGAWQNVMMFMGDDGNGNLHMTDCNNAAELVLSSHPGYQVKKVMWDAYQEEVTSTGNRYPEVTSIIKQQQKQGALIMDYSGHGRADWISHEAVLTLRDFQAFTNKNLPLWITASCDIMAFDGRTDNIGETAVLNANGGAIAFYGTTRTVYSYYNGLINRAYLRYVLSTDNGKPVTLGEAQRLAKNYLITSGSDKTVNKLQYTLLGDPALALNLPKATVVIDSINGQPVGSTPVSLASGSVASVAGHVSGAGTEVLKDFNGTVSLQVMDSRELITCHMNPSARSDKGANTPFQFYNRTKSVYSGTDSVSGGRFSMQFVVPVDLNYDNGTGLVCAYAVNSDRSLSAHGSSEAFILGGNGTAGSDSIGPKIRCYLNSPDFQNGGNVNPTPYFAASLSDDDGINATGNGIGHDLELVVDGEAARTYNLNDNFQFDFGSYTSGSTWYSIPALEPGHHSLLFRAWDNMNNCSTATLDFTVVKGLVPTIFSVAASHNPASASTTFIINHNFAGCELAVSIDVFDMSGRLLWTHNEVGTSDTGNYTIDWDLTTENGRRMQTGVYLYRARVSSDGSASASKAKKLIIINNN